jgi:hypothetical protein
VITGRACGQLSSCAASPGIQATLALEARIGCSCCASQICACDAPNAETDEAIYQLNVDQCARGITPQCCRNGTLCGRRNGQPFTCSDGKCPS